MYPNRTMPQIDGVIQLKRDAYYPVVTGDILDDRDACRSAIIEWAAAQGWEYRPEGQMCDERFFHPASGWVAVFSFEEERIGGPYGPLVVSSRGVELVGPTQHSSAEYHDIV